MDLDSNMAINKAEERLGKDVTILRDTEEGN
jgi:hypothetical protein